MLKLKGGKRGFDAKNEEGREWRGRLRLCEREGGRRMGKEGWRRE